MSWEYIYTLFTVVAISIGCYACFAETKSIVAFSGLAVYICGVIMSYYVAKRN